MSNQKTKHLLSQAYRIDQRINSKLEQAQSLRELAAKASATLSDMPRSGTRNVQRMEEIIAKMVDIETEINNDIDYLINTKREVMSIIKGVSKPEYQSLLELRYLCFKSWEQIAYDLNYSVSWVLKLHYKALRAVDAVMIGKEKKNGLA
jgi:lambda repressor-like predicted transcriptional regulator